MKKSYTTASVSLGVYQVLVRSLPTPVIQEKHARLQWAQRKIPETTHRINDTSPSAQNLLAAEIVGLKNIAHSLDLIQLKIL